MASDALLPDPGWSCDRCGRPVVQTADGEWAHAEVADALFCGLVMGAAERVAKAGGDE